MIRGVDGRRIVFWRFSLPPLSPLLRVIVEYAYNIHQVFRREANRSRFALPCKCAIIYLNVSQSTIPWIHARARVYNIFVPCIRVFETTLPQQLNGKSQWEIRNARGVLSPESIFLDISFGLIMRNEWQHNFLRSRLMQNLIINKNSRQFNN